MSLWVASVPEDSLTQSGHTGLHGISGIYVYSTPVPCWLVSGYSLSPALTLCCPVHQFHPLGPWPCCYSEFFGCCISGTPSPLNPWNNQQNLSYPGEYSLLPSAQQCCATDVALKIMSDHCLSAKGSTSLCVHQEFASWRGTSPGQHNRK